MVDLYIANIEKLEMAIASTGESASRIAVSGKLSRDTLTKARKGIPISRAKANGIVNGLNINDCNPQVDFISLFSKF